MSRDHNTLSRICGADSSGRRCTERPLPPLSLSRPGLFSSLASWDCNRLLGLLSLMNIVIRAVLTAPGPFNLIHAEVPNLMIGTFPFMFIPEFFEPLAVVLHVLAVRAIASTICLK